MLRRDGGGGDDDDGDGGGGGGFGDGRCGERSLAVWKLVGRR